MSVIRGSGGKWSKFWSKFSAAVEFDTSAQPKPQLGSFPAPMQLHFCIKRFDDEALFEPNLLSSLSSKSKMTEKQETMFGTKLQCNGL